ncbi:MAG TPA: glucose-6-phosphate dehydrogenase [Candidatus Dojkabacteria bacterium]|jgi:glucose-6-phosphate 1-dehydrogenase
MTKPKEAFQIIIFGASGDLTKSKLIPALWNLYIRSKLPENFSIIGVARREWSDEDFATHMNQFINLENEKEKWETFASHLHFVSGDFEDKKIYTDLSDLIHKKDKEWDIESEKIVYLAVSANSYNTIIDGIDSCTLKDICSIDTSKIVIEKPFGNDYSSAYKLNEKLTSIFNENQIYRIDHVLGKDTLVDIDSFRDSNIIFSDLFNNKYVDHIQISFLENIGVGSRGKFYEETGVIRDMLQNHLVEMLSIAIAPISQNEKEIYKSRARIIDSLSLGSFTDVVVGQYESYTKERDVSEDSKVPTFIALKSTLNTPEWKNVPVYFRTGKSLEQKFTEISIVFKSKSENVKPNILSFRIQPQEGIYINVIKRKIGTEELENVSLDFCYKYDPKTILRDAYENLLLDVINSSRKYFVDIDEVLGAWKFVDPIVKEVESGRLPIIKYKDGTWGPQESYELINQDARKWYTEDFQLVCKLY